MAPISRAVPYNEAMRFPRLIVAPLTSLLLLVGISSAFSATANPKKGQLCAKADVGKTANDASGGSLTCAADSKGKNRWTAGAAALATTKATTATTKAPKTTKSSGSTATTKATKTTKTSGSTATTKTTKSSGSGGGSTGTAVAVKGRFCKNADDGVKANDKNGVKLVCSADAKGKHRWQAA